MLLFEREPFARYHIGESLLSATLPILDALGVNPSIEQLLAHCLNTAAPKGGHA